MFLVLWLKHPSTIPGTSLNVSTLHSWGLCIQLFLWGLSFHYRQRATRRPLHTIVSVWGIIETVTILYAWLSREYLTAVGFGPIIFHHQTRFGAYWNVCMFQVLSRSASFTVNSHFWHINSSIQLPLSALMTAVMSMSAGITHSTTNYQHDIGFSVGWKTLCWVAAHYHKSFHLNISAQGEI